MDWSAVGVFMRQSGAFNVDAMRGVPAQEIHAAEARYGLTLPRSYVEFLSRMGADAAGFAPFGAGYDHTWPTLRSYLADPWLIKDCLPGLLPVAIDRGEGQITPMNYLLDLQRCDGQDAPLVMVEDGIGCMPEAVVEVGQTFDAAVVEQIARLCDLELRPTTLAIMDHGDADPAALLAAVGLPAALPTPPTVAYGRDERHSLFAQRRRGHLQLLFAADTPATIAAAVARLHPYLTDARTWS